MTLLDEYLGSWIISSPSRCDATAALIDIQWLQARVDLKRQSAILSELLVVYGLTADGKTNLFHWIKASEEKKAHPSIAKQGILTRLFD